MSTHTVEERPIKRIKLETGYVGVTLPPPELIPKISLETFDAHISEVTGVAKLSVTQLEYVRTCRRLIRNREYARTSRFKRRQQADEMRQRIEQLEYELACVHKHCASLLNTINELKQSSMRCSPIIESEFLSTVEWF